MPEETAPAKPEEEQDSHSYKIPFQFFLLSAG
jgi:hypothetical protein